MFRLILLMTVQGFLLVLSQVFLKLGLNKSEELHFDWQSLLLIIKNYYYWLAALTMTLAGIVWLNVLRKHAFSVAYPLVSISYIFSLIAASYIFRETVPVVRWLGVLVIILGIVLVTRGYK